MGQRDKEREGGGVLLAMKMEEVTMKSSYLEPPEGTPAFQRVDLGPRKPIIDF